MKPPSQFTLPKSGKGLPPKKVNKILDAQSDEAVGLPVKKPVVPIKSPQKLKV